MKKWEKPEVDRLKIEGTEYTSWEEDNCVEYRCKVCYQIFVGKGNVQEHVTTHPDDDGDGIMDPDEGVNYERTGNYVCTSNS